MGLLVSSQDEREQRAEEFLPLFPSRSLEQRRLVNASLIEPWQHAEGLDGLAGLYAIINGFGLALARRRPLSPATTRDLLESGITFIGTHTNLARSLTRGCRLELWLKLADALRRVMEREHEIRLCIEQPLRGVRHASSREVLNTVETFILRQQVVMLMLHGCRYTTVLGYTEHSLLLFDSGGRRWIRRSACGVTGDGKRHQIYVPSLTAISVL